MHTNYVLLTKTTLIPISCLIPSSLLKILFLPPKSSENRAWEIALFPFPTCTACCLSSAHFSSYSFWDSKELQVTRLEGGSQKLGENQSINILQKIQHRYSQVHALNIVQLCSNLHHKLLFKAKHFYAVLLFKRKQEKKSSACALRHRPVHRLGFADTPRGSVGSGFSTEAVMQKALIKNSNPPLQ